MKSSRVDVDVATLVRVPSATIEFLEKLEFDVFVLSPHGRPTLFCSREYWPSSQEWAAIRRKAGQLYVRATDRDRWRSQVVASVDQLLEAEKVPPVRQFEFLQAVMDDSLRRSMFSANLTETIHQSRQFGRRMATVLTREVAVGELFAILRHDFDTFSHVVNVASYCALLAIELGVRERDELEKIVVGGLLHDVGKRYIPTRILAKPGPLTPEEWEFIWRHPLQGFVDLRGRKELEIGQLMMVYQHHERIDGGGYPVGVTGEEMHPWSQLCAVCDVFEALTGERPYRKPMSITSALEYLSENAGKHFDREMVQCWMSAVKQTLSTPAGIN